MSLFLIITGPGGQAQECNLATSRLPLTIGRSGGESHITLDDSHLSRNHCVILKDDTEFIFHDLRSSNGSSINGKATDVAALRDGDSIQIGSSKIIVKSLSTEHKDPLIGINLNGYVIQSIIGRGSQATVYLATQLNLQRQVAMKIIKASADNQHQIASFDNEAYQISHLNHQHIVRAHDVFEVDKLHVIVMELLEGHSALYHFQQSGPFAYEDGLKVLMHMSGAIAHLREINIIHRDLKPANIIRGRGGDYILTDFGLARQAKNTFQPPAGKLQGTPLYMSPEQIRCTALDHRSDIYGLGACIWHLISGRPVYTGTLAEIVNAHVKQALPDLNAAAPGLHPGLRALIIAMLEKNPANRPATADEVLKLAQSFIGNADSGDKETTRIRRRREGTGTSRILKKKQ